MRALYLLLALVASLACGNAYAACPAPYTAKDAAGSTQNFASINDASNNCVFESAPYAAVQFTATLQSAVTASGNGTALTVSGTGGVAITVNCSACSGGTTVNFEGQEDGSDFASMWVAPLAGGALVNSTTTSGITVWQGSTAGLQQIRARVSGYSAGTITVTAHASAVPFAVSPPSVPTVNITQFGGSNIVTGTGASGSGIPRVTISNDSSLAANQTVNNAQWGGTNVVTGGVAGSVGSGGLAGNGVAVAGNPMEMGCRAQNAEPTAVTNGQNIFEACELTGKQIVQVFANKENFLSGDSSAVTTAANTSLIAAQAAGIKIYLTAYSCANSGVNNSIVQFTSGSGGPVLWTASNPAGSGVTGQIIPPVPTGAATALFLKTGTASTSQECSVSGYAGT